ncbi:hypothetical protein PHPALM_29006 [Phytophthora palmivora]|uniref:PiggyBac transposable element-derived protein domain-containing protein n=1 Tax=Phytophthora palmivora TaxID=4796 RepID=A0A2P4X8N5_9STRA|nr:hypothetical protein PHPALM_29006 [Phytophthora palmivora]
MVRYHDETFFTSRSEIALNLSCRFCISTVSLEVRSLLQTLKKTFRWRYRLGKVLSFDEGVVLKRSKFNPKRVSAGQTTQIRQDVLHDVVDYGLGMGGVDVHNQLRLHRYSIQKCVFSWTVNICIVDIAGVNGFIVHCFTLKESGIEPPIYAEYLRRLHNQLLVLQTINFEIT